MLNPKTRASLFCDMMDVFSYQQFVNTRILGLPRLFLRKNAIHLVTDCITKDEVI